jgi:hypothetical protein
VDGGIVVLEDATKDGGTKGGTFQVSDFAMSVTLQLPNIPSRIPNMNVSSRIPMAFPIPNGGNFLPRQTSGGRITKNQSQLHLTVLICHARVSAGLIAWLFVFGFQQN